MAWVVEIDPAAAKELRKLDPPVAKRILAFVRALRGEPLGGYWKYRLGAYRLICRIIDRRLIVTCCASGHRGEVYRP